MLKLTLLTGCATMGTNAPIDTFAACQSFKPITWSKHDTVLTAKQVKEHNAAFKALCEEAPKQ